MTNTYQQYQWTAFREADLLGSGDWDLGHGDSFTMPSSPTVTLASYDNDAKLSGDQTGSNDRWDNSTDTHGQDGFVNGHATGPREMFVEQTWTLLGSDGKTYTLAEIEIGGHNAAGNGDDYFSFVGAVPPAGVTLTVLDKHNVTGDGIHYSDLSATPPSGNPHPDPDPDPVDGILCVVDFEDFARGDQPTGLDGGFVTVSGSQNGVMIFDTDNITGNDFDLANGDGNVLIVSEDGDASDPDDDAGGGTIVFDFAELVEFNGLTVIDTEEGGSVSVLDANGNTISSVVIPSIPNGAVQDIDVDVAGAAQVVVVFNGSGAVDDLTYTKPEPEPEVGSLSGRYFCDTDDDSQDNNNGDEPGVEGVLVMLLDANGEPTGDQVFTDANGEYAFEGLAPGTYGVKFTDPDNVLDGKVLVDPNVGPDASDSDAIGDTGESVIAGIEVVAGQNTPDNDAGVEEVTGQIGGRYFCDEDGNDRDDGEPGVEGATVWLIKIGEGVVATTTTDANGEYCFEDLEAGQYKVRFEDPNDVDGSEGKSFVTANVGDDENDSDVTKVGGNGNGNTARFTLDAGESKKNVDAGVAQEVGSLSGRYFCDTDDDSQDNNNGDEPGVEGVLVMLLDANGEPTGDQVFTDANGEYSFGDLAPGTYGVKFTDPNNVLDGKALVDPNVGPDESDSDAIGDTTEAVIANIVVVANENTPDNDAGVEQEPMPVDDAAITCADDVAMVDVLANDDLEPGSAITAVDGQAISEGQSITTGAGTIVTLENGVLLIDGEDAYQALDIGETDVEVISYTVEGANGTSSTADLEVTFKGDANSVEGLAQNLPETATIQLVDENDPAGSSDEAFTVRISNGSMELDGIYAEAYCISIFDPFVADGFGSDVTQAPAFEGEVYLGIESEVPDGALDTIGINGATAAENLDEITWILNQDFGSQGFTDAEIQGAIWALTDGQSIEDDFNFDGGIFIADGGGDAADAQMIVDLALANGSGFVAGDGDIVGVIIDPNDAEFQQPFIVGVAYDDIDCIC